MAVVPGSARAATPVLSVTFKFDGTFTVSLNGRSLGATSAPGGVIPPGYYEVVVDDTAEIGYMYFDLQGPGVSILTNNFEGADAYQSYFETFLPSSTYTYRDSFNPKGATMYFSTSGASTGGASSAPSASTSPTSGSGDTNGTVVGSKSKSKASTATTTKAASSPILGTLYGTIGTHGAITFTRGPKAVTSIHAGRYTLIVLDTTSSDGFTIRATKAQPLAVSGVSFVGKKTATLTFSTGQWMYYGTTASRSHYFLVTG
ncbi:MAG: hypothetical protein WCH31_09810 [Actinomycetes bacterium]